MIKNLIPKKESKEDENQRKKQASELLKNADRFYKLGDLSEALKEVEQTLAIDPSNFYARAYKERILHTQQHPEAMPKSQKEDQPKPPQIQGEKKSPNLQQKSSDDHDDFRQRLIIQQKKVEEEKKRAEEEQKRHEQELRRRS
ncbi:MAG TPA: hypothetical protein VKI62_04745, partial [Bacteroidota bacterium]|nr:hypothetical protein [Bacteroidota bacterium]